MKDGSFLLKILGFYLGIVYFNNTVFKTHPIL